jgi:aspartyl-tRNA(Asn)/glutamyl-tRNA(Gln) amidotransferase subunit C
MSITREEVEHVALLSRLALSPEEIDLYTGHLQEILGYAEKIQQLDTSQVEPMSHSIRITNVMREADEVGPMMDSDTATENAPDKAGPYYRVPKVTEVS